MNNFDMPVPEQTAGSAYGGSDVGYVLEKLASDRRRRVPTVRENIVERIAALEQQLASHKSVLAVLDETPNVEKVLDALRKIGV